MLQGVGIYILEGNRSHGKTRGRRTISAPSVVALAVLCRCCEILVFFLAVPARTTPGALGVVVLPMKILACRSFEKARFSMFKTGECCSIVRLYAAGIVYRRHCPTLFKRNAPPPGTACRDIKNMLEGHLVFCFFVFCFFADCKKRPIEALP